MALTVEDGTGVAGADSYNETTEVETFADEYGYDKTGFKALDQTGKDAACRLAAVVLNDKYEGRWPGLRRFEEQGLPWPQTDGLYIDGFAIPYDEVPEEVKHGHAYLALLSGSGTDIAADTESTMMIGEVRAASGAGVKFVQPISTKQFRVLDMLLRRVLSATTAKWSKVPA